jgi:ParB-like chromosome segregation protein Spo0J
MDVEIERMRLDDLMLDPRNPRLGRRLSNDDITQPMILDLMRAHSLEELGTSFVESGFWPQEALLCVEESIDNQPSLIVVEGNRRLAALKILKASVDGNPPSPSWARIVDGWSSPENFFEAIPVMRMIDRQSVDIYLGYRHVTGIKEWNPAEKAEYIAYLIDQRGFTYEEVMRKIGSKTEAVRRNYIAYRVYRQAGNEENIDEAKIIEKFSVLFLALRTSGVQSFLGVDIKAEPQQAQNPVPPQHVQNLREFVRWLFGQDEVEPIVKDSRQVDKFSRALESENALSYLRTASRPTLEYAYVIAGGEAEDVRELLSGAAFDIEQALGMLHLHTDDSEIAKVANRIVRAARQIEKLFPEDQAKGS